MGNVAVSVESLGKRYRIAHQRDPYGRLTETLAGALRAPVDRLRGKTRESMEWFWALRDVSFDLHRGEVLGVIGRNGAGKSTLLKILSRITEPTEGNAELRGRVGSLLEVGTGFHPELTGRENIFMSGAVLGMRRSDIARRFDEIVAFAGVEQFLDTPVKRYSSGMQVRLGFAVAAHLEPEILFVDEVLAVGDASFQRKSIGRLQDVARGGRTVLFVSHDLGVIDNLTTFCIYLEAGRIKQFGPTRSIVRAYLDDSATRDAQASQEVSYYRRSEVPDAPARIVAIHCPSREAASIELGEPITIQVTIDVLRPIESIEITLILRDERSRSVAVLYSGDSNFRLTSDPGARTVQVEVRDLPLSPGLYFGDIGLNRGPSSEGMDVILEYPLLEIVNTGQIVQWLDRPWGAVHPRDVCWNVAP
jgi:lipopolysaccharide transport system ATP-binding protein